MNTAHAIFWLAYSVIGIVLGYLAARDCYNNGMTDVEAYSAGWSFVVWIVFGATWIIWTFFLAIILLVEFSAPAFRWVAKRIF